MCAYMRTQLVIFNGSTVLPQEHMSVAKVTESPPHGCVISKGLSHRQTLETELA